jgi:hypothetical protein
MGTLITTAEAQRVEAAIRAAVDSGATLLTGGERDGQCGTGGTHLGEIHGNTPHFNVSSSPLPRADFPNSLPEWSVLAIRAAPNLWRGIAALATAPCSACQPVNPV